MSERITDDLDGLLTKDPFIPFHIIRASGTSYVVTNPLQLVPAETRYTYFFPRSDRFAIFRANQIVSMETLDE